jgi:hypothetical protein
MNELHLLPEILSLYRKFDWQLRQVLLTPEAKAALDEKLTAILGNVEIVEGEIDALWLSRPSGKDGEAWELRLISANAYALFEVFRAAQPNEEREDIKSDMEMRLVEYFFPDLRSEKTV